MVNQKLKMQKSKLQVKSQNIENFFNFELKF